MLTIPPEAQPEPHAPTDADAQLRDALKVLRAAVRSNPHAKAALTIVEAHSKHKLKIVNDWDTCHAERAELLIRLGQIAAANSATQMIFNDDRRVALLRRCLIGYDSSATERMAEAVEFEREVIHG